MVEIIYYSGCISCRKAKKWLEDNGITYKMYDIKDERLDREQLKRLHLKSGLPIDDFFNTKGARFKALELEEKFSNMTDGEKFELLLSDKMLIKRPIILEWERAYVGFNEEKWLGIIKAKKYWRETKDMPDECENFIVNMPLTDEQIFQIKLGFYPRNMDKKWFVYAEGDDVYFHRSLSGECIFIVRLGKDGNHTVTVNRNKEVYRSGSIEKENKQ